MATYFNAMGNEFFTILQESNRLHLNVQQRYLQLLNLLKDKHVAFKDIKPRLLKEAKRCGLYRKDTYNEKTGKNQYRTLTSLKNAKVAWFHEMMLFVSWCNRNYIGYDKAKPKAIPGLNKKKSATVITRKKTGEEVRTETIGATTEELKSQAPMLAPVEKELTTIEKQQVILQNFDVLGEVCKSKSSSALEAFNLLMIELGQDHEIIEVDEFSRPNILGNEAPVDGPFGTGINNPTVAPVQ